MTGAIRTAGTVAWLLAVGFALPVLAAELRCDELGANCVCSEPFNTSSYSFIGEYYNPGDSTDRECSFEAPQFPVFVRDNRAGPTADAEALSRLPAGHTVEWFLGSAPGGNGSFWAGNGNAGEQYVARYAVRFYVYTSPDYEFVGEGACENSKLMQIGPIAIDQSQGHVHAYGFNLHRYDGGRRVIGDCCTFGPPLAGAGFSNTTAAGLRGKWWRYELIVTNRAGGPEPNGIRYQLFGKNVTDQRPEIAIMDTGVPCPRCNPDPRGLGSKDLTPEARMDSMLVNLYRQGTCEGWRGLSHLLYAGWDTDAGQRIGSAAEVEGVSGVVDSPAPRRRSRRQSR